MTLELMANIQMHLFLVPVGGSITVCMASSNGNGVASFKVVQVARYLQL